MATTTPPRRKANPPAPAVKAVPGKKARQPAAKTVTQPAVQPAAPAAPASKAAPMKAAPPPKAAAAKKAAAKKAAAKPVAKKAVAKSAVAKGTAPKPAVTPKGLAKKAGARPQVAKKVVGRKAGARKVPAPQVAAQQVAAQQVAAPQVAAQQVAAQQVAAQKVAAKKSRAKPRAAAAALSAVPLAGPSAVAAAAPLLVAPAGAPPPGLPVVDRVAGLVADPVADPTATPAPRPSGPAHSQITLTDGPRRWLRWQPGQACPPTLQAAAALRLDADQHFAPDDDTALPTLLRMAADAGHALRVHDAVWPHLAAHRDARSRLAVLAAAYPDGPASPGLRGLLRSPLPAYQAEGALFAVVAGRALLADERGLGKGVMAMAAAALWQRHFGVRRILLLCAPGQRAAWQRAWARFADPAGPLAAAQVMDGGLHQRQVLWSGPAGVRILSPDALASDSAHAAHWAPDLVIVDEPQQLGLHAADWAGLQCPHALVLCGAPLAEQPALMQAILAWLDTERLGPLAALHELQAASAQGLALTEPDIERLTASLSRTMLQRDRADLADQLPPLVHSERLLVLAPGQRQVHDQQLEVVQRLLAGWQHSGYLSDADQWRLAQALRALQQACHRADPSDAGSALAEPTVQALQAQLADWAATGPLQIAVLCASVADRAQLAQRLWVAGDGGDSGEGGEGGDGGDGGDGGEGGEGGEGGDGPNGLHLLLPDDALPAGLDAVLQAGVPWRTRRSPAGPRGQAAPGQQWVYLVAQDSLEGGLFNTLAGRLDVPRGLAGPDDSAGGHFLHGDRLADWLKAVAAAVQAALPGGR